MNIVKFLGAGLIKILLISVLSAFILTSTMAHFSARENLLPVVQNLAMDKISQDQIDYFYNLLKDKCQNGEEVFYENISLMNITVRVDCTKLNADKDAEIRAIFKEQIVGNAYDQVYNLQCDGIKCIQEGTNDPRLLLSKSFHEFLSKIEITIILAIVAFSILLWLAYESLSGKLIGLGAPFLISGIPYPFMGMVESKTLQSLPELIREPSSKILEPIFGYMSNLMLICLVLGILLIAAGIIIKIKQRKEENEEAK